MKKQSIHFSEDARFKKLNDDIIWDKAKQQQLYHKTMNTINKVDRKIRIWKVVKYSTGVAVLLLLLFVGYHFLQQELWNPVLNHTNDPRENPTPAHEKKHELQYYGVNDEEGSYETVAMMDSNAMYFIPVNIPNLDQAARAALNFAASERFRAELLDQYDLSPALANIPLQHSELLNHHLHLYFDREDLLQVRGSTGVSMGYYSISNFAKNLSEQVERYTAYGDGEPFDHDGEEFVLENKEVDRQASFFPVATEKGIFLREDYSSYSDLEELFTAFFSVHERPDLDTPAIDLSMLSINRMEPGDTEILIELTGALTSDTLNSNIDRDSMKLLLAHGIGLNIRFNQHLLDQPIERAKIVLNGENLFEGSLSSIRYNVLDQLNLDHVLDQTSELAKEDILRLSQQALTALENQDWNELSDLVHPQKGLLFSIYPYVDLEQNLVFTKEEVTLFKDNNQIYLFGIHHMNEDHVYEYTPKDFINKILLHFEYKDLNETKIDYQKVTYNERSSPSGGVIHNIRETYPNGKFVEFYSPAPDGERSHLWQALTFVFEQVEVEEDNQWLLVAIVRDVHSP